MKRDTEQFLSLLTGCQASLYAYILSLVPDRQRAEDILQETNLVLWRKGEDFEQGTSFIAWACQVAYFNIISDRRRRCRDKHIFNDELLDYLAERQSERVEMIEARQRALRQCLEKLPSRQRQAIESRYQPGASVREMASAMRMSEGALSQFLYRIRGALLQCIQKRLEPEVES